MVSNVCYVGVFVLISDLCVASRICNNELLAMLPNYELGKILQKKIFLQICLA